jgi:predicted  nucleic acid-binding Zn-ribbon protein
VSLNADEIGLDWDELRGRFEMGEGRQRERERKRLSDDLERMRRRERELEDDMARSERRRGLDREAMDRLQRDFQAWNGVSEWERRL